MHPSLLPLLLLLPPALPTTPPPKTYTLHHTPAAPTPLALLTYTPHHSSLSTLTAFTPPPNTTDPDARTSIVVYLSTQRVGGDRYRSSVTATNSFHAPCRGRFRVVVGGGGEVVGASWRAWCGPGGGGEGAGRGDFDIVSVKAAPGVVFEKGGKGKGGAGGLGAGKEGEGEGEEVEKTMLQK